MEPNVQSPKSILKSPTQKTFSSRKDIDKLVAEFGKLEQWKVSDDELHNENGSF